VGLFRAAALGGAVAVFLHTLRAGAQSLPAPADAAKLFDEARVLMADGQYAEACAKLEASEAQDPGIGTEFNLARCYELVGRFASARGMYRRVVEETHAAGQTEREVVAHDLNVKLQGRVAHLVLQVASPPQAALEIRVDGALLPSSEWGQPREVDPGPHEVEASAAGLLPWKTTARVAGEGTTVTLDVPPLLPRAAVEPVVVAPSAAMTPRTSEASSGTASSSQRIVALALGGLGLAGLVPGTYFGLQAASLESRANPLCPGNQCDSTGYSDRTSSRWNGDASTVSFVVSGALLAAAGIVWLTAPHAP
jgi:hypothetical protein